MAERQLHGPQRILGVNAAKLADRPYRVIIESETLAHA
jgi:hypothetical protein